ncbi:MAG TPA: tRNA (N(6)-L-threonylcarbamoyladenosine(37)-C(2))-methylthiotransferase MtaB [Candidatus Sulfomarinibacteraceae bacterium]|nr:tRNA (N(6)-L-threonylcarbamoyladenosine(37)-C(2))-methylthiotransferase MtaB [Candidatus Sulfomarinibacteraceae bacterium]
MRIRLESVGCRLNIGEIEAFGRRLSRLGQCVVADGAEAELIILNTCAVTATAARKSRHLIRQLRRRNPEARFVVTGCLAELDAEQVADLGIDLVVGNDDKDDLVDRLVAGGLLRATSAGEAAAEPEAGSFPGRTRAFLKVQDGCDNRCAFCIVTRARGRGRSRPASEVVRDVRELVRAGYVEVVLSGVHLGSWGHDLGQPGGLEDLVRTLLTDTGLPRLRLSSLEPWDLDEGFFALFEDRRLLPHLHLPLQSGCDATLARMARRTTLEDYRALLVAARRAVPDLAVSTDVMVAFPGETDAEFETSLAAVEELAFSRLHVFRYSRRPGTPAAAMPDQVPRTAAAERSARMQALGERLSDRFHRAHLGRRLPVLWESWRSRGRRRRWSGLSDNYIRVFADTGSEVELSNHVTEVELEGCSTEGMTGRIADGVQPAFVSPTLPVVP